jgi:hypothetical protein
MAHVKIWAVVALLATATAPVTAQAPDIGKLRQHADGYRTQGNYKEAEPLLVQMLAVREADIGPDHADLVPHCSGVSRWPSLTLIPSYTT